MVDLCREGGEVRVEGESGPGQGQKAHNTNGWEERVRGAVAAVFSLTLTLSRSRSFSLPRSRSLSLSLTFSPSPSLPPSLAPSRTHLRSEA